MTTSSAHIWPATLAAFLASLVEFVEALTVVLAVGAIRGWRGALLGSALALALLLLIVAALGSGLERIPLHLVQIALGTLLLLFGMRWLRKAILRAAGVIPVRDEAAAFASQTASLSRHGGIRAGLDPLALGAAFKITMLEGLEVIFIVIAVGAGGSGLLLPASAGALAALILVALLGWAVHRPLAAVPENSLKLLVGVLLTAFGTFWLGEGAGLRWPGADWSMLGLIAGFLAVALGILPWCRARAGARPSAARS